MSPHRARTPGRLRAPGRGRARPRRASAAPRDPTLRMAGSPAPGAATRAHQRCPGAPGSLPARRRRGRRRARMRPPRCTRPARARSYRAPGAGWPCEAARRSRRAWGRLGSPRFRTLKPHCPLPVTQLRGDPARPTSHHPQTGRPRPSPRQWPFASSPTRRRR